MALFLSSGEANCLLVPQLSDSITHLWQYCPIVPMWEEERLGIESRVFASRTNSATFSDRSIRGCLAQSKRQNVDQSGQEDMIR